MSTEPEPLGDAEYRPLVPFLNQDPVYTYGVEFGFWWKDVQAMDPGGERTAYVRTENEEQMRLACTRMGWEVTDLRPWDDGPPDNGWVLLTVRKPTPEGVS